MSINHCSLDRMFVVGSASPHRSTIAANNKTRRSISSLALI